MFDSLNFNRKIKYLDSTNLPLVPNPGLVKPATRHHNLYVFFKLSCCIHVTHPGKSSPVKEGC